MHLWRHLHGPFIAVQPWKDKVQKHCVFVHENWLPFKWAFIGLGFEFMCTVFWYFDSKIPLPSWGLHFHMQIHHTERLHIFCCCRCRRVHSTLVPDNSPLVNTGKWAGVLPLFCQAWKIHRLSLPHSGMLQDQHPMVVFAWADSEVIEKVDFVNPNWSFAPNSTIGVPGRFLVIWAQSFIVVYHACGPSTESSGRRPDPHSSGERAVPTWPVTLEKRIPYWCQQLAFYPTLTSGRNFPTPL